MLGKPLYNYGDRVRFTVCGKKHEGVIEVIDRWGTLEQSEEVSYDIFDTEEEVLYKHIREHTVTGRADG